MLAIWKVVGRKEKSTCTSSSESHAFLASVICANIHSLKRGYLFRAYLLNIYCIMVSFVLAARGIRDTVLVQNNPLRVPER